MSEIHINIKDNASSIETEEEGILKTTSRTLQLLDKIARCSGLHLQRQGIIINSMGARADAYKNKDPNFQNMMGC